MTVLHDLGLWLWRLLPANPIFVRVVSGGGKRMRHLHARWIYLVVLFVVMLVFGGGGLSTKAQSLADYAKQATNVFMWVSMVQLFLMAFIAPVFTAGAITQEKDANTFHILLTTPMSTGQVVLGALFGRLYFVWVMLLSGLPIFCITMIYGGVTTTEVFLSFGLAATTGFVTGALAIMISFVKIGTRRTIFSFFLGIAVYLLTLGVFGWSRFGWLVEAPAGPSGLRLSWLAPIHPFLALLEVTGQTPAPPLSDVLHYGWPFSVLLAYPAYGYMFITSLASVLMIVISIFFVRQGQKEGELTLWNRLVGFFTRKDPAGEKTQRPRRVWSNPIAWREANTRASAGGRSGLRWVFVIAGIVGAVVLLIAHENAWWQFNPNKPGLVRDWLTALTWIELAVILLIVTNAAATSLTREKESMTMELLLSTPLTSKYIVAGMLRGLVSFAVPLIIVPAVTLLLFVVADLRRPANLKVTTFESILLLPVLLVAFAALSAMIGLYFSLTQRKTVQAVMISTALVMGVSGLLFACGAAISSGGEEMIAAIVRPFTPFTAVQALVDYEVVFRGSSTPPSPAERFAVRIARSLCSLIAIAIYSGITFAFYNSMVRNFDMTVRRQSATT